MVSSFCIVYGFDNIDELLYPRDANLSVILVEPRKHIQNLISKNTLQLPKGTIVIPRLLSGTNVLQEIVMQHTNNQFYVSTPPPPSSSLLQREKVYSTSLRNIIRQYNIRSVYKLIINIPIDNVHSVIDNIELHNTIFKEIRVDSNVQVHQSTVLSQNFEHVYRNVHGYDTYMHNRKKSDEPLPRIAMYLTEPVPDHCKEEFETLLSHHNINILSSDPLKNTPVYEYISTVLSQVDWSNVDYVVQFNPKYFSKQDAFPMPLDQLRQHDTLIIKQDYDIIYGSKNTMYNLLDVVKSYYFADYLAEKESSKKALFKIFRKRYFYEYIAKTFKVQTLDQ